MTETRKYSRTEDDGLDRRAAPGRAAVDSIEVRADATAERFAQLGLDVPSVSVLPRNFATVTSASDFVFEQMTSDMRTLGRRAGISVVIPGPTDFRALHEKDHEIIAPIVQFSHEFLIDGGAALAVAFLEQFAQHVASRWGIKKAKEMKAVLDVVITKGKNSKRITYQGPVEGLPRVAAIAQTVFNKHDDDER
jgi:hypothetical protein